MPLVAEKKTTKKSASPTTARSKSSSKVKVKDLAPKKDPRGGDRPHNFNDGGGSADE
jgi:hypothetical protein